MVFTLAEQMDTVFRHGLQVIRQHEEHILLEWDNTLSNRKEISGRSAAELKSAIHFLSGYFFSSNGDISLLKNKELINNYIGGNVEINQTFMTLLENAIHKVIQKEPKQAYKDHQAIQYVFVKIAEKKNLSSVQQYFSIEAFLKDLTASSQLPVEWTAIVRKEELYIVEKWFNRHAQNLIPQDPNLKADSIYRVSELLLNETAEERRKELHVVPIAHEEKTILFCVDSTDITHVVPFITYALHVFRQAHDALEMTQREQDWKDSVMLFNELIMRSRSYQEAMENITAGFVKYLPFERSALFSYSPDDQEGFGLYGYKLNNEMIQNITEDISNLPIIQRNLNFLEVFGENMKYLQPIYIKDAAIGFPKQYVRKFELKSVVVAPIFTSIDNQLLGAVILDQGPDGHFKLTQETTSALIRFGQSAGEMLSKYTTDRLRQQNMEEDQLSPREISVLKLMAEGASTSEAAAKIHLSEYTVRDYVSAILQKMNAQNRTEAVAIAIRKGII